MTDDSASTMDAREAFDQLADIALSEHSLHSVLQTVSDLTKTVMPGDIEASVSMLIADKAATVVYTGQLALDLDESQYGRGYGPCLHAASTGETVEVADTRREPRWADYMQACVERECLSSLSIPLGNPDRLAAALNIYSRQAAAFTDEDRAAANRFARFAGVAVANMYAYQSARELADNLEIAMTSRALIDQAKGILMERHKVTADQAFEVLAQTSMATNQKLRDVADYLVRSGELPARGPRRSSGNLRIAPRPAPEQTDKQPSQPPPGR